MHPKRNLYLVQCLFRNFALALAAFVLWIRWNTYYISRYYLRWKLMKFEPQCNNGGWWNFRQVLLRYFSKCNWSWAQLLMMNEFDKLLFLCFILINKFYFFMEFLNKYILIISFPFNMVKKTFCINWKSTIFYTSCIIICTVFSQSFQKWK